MSRGPVAGTRAPSASDVAEFGRAFERTWPRSTPDMWEMRARTPDRWVRFHSLPDSKRYPDTPREMSEVLRRHHAIVTALVSLVGDREPAPLLVMTCSYLPGDFGPDPSAVVPRRTHWRVFYDGGMDGPGDDDLDTPIAAWLSEVSYSRGALDPLLARIADFEIARVIIFDRFARWSYRPYDGGGDVRAPNQTARNALTERFAAWASPYPHGL